MSSPVRAEGLAELVGDITVSCYGTLPAQVNVNLTLNTNITSNRNYQGGDITDAALVVESSCPWPPCPAPTTRWGKLVSDKSLQWDAVPLPVPPGSMGSVNIRITNVRAVAFGVVPGAPPMPAMIMAAVSIYAGGPDPLYSTASYPQAVAFVLPGLGASLQPPAFESLRIRLQEGFPTAFKPLGMPLPVSVFPGANQEDGLLTPGSGKNDGGATQGTRFMIRFLNAPRGASILVPHALGLNSGALELRRVFNADANGAGGCYYLGCLEPPPAGSFGEATPSGYDAFAVYEVTNSLPYSVEYVDIPVAVCQGRAGENGCRILAGTPAMKETQVRVSLAPVSTVTTADTESPRPRFVESGIPMDVVRWPR